MTDLWAAAGAAIDAVFADPEDLQYVSRQYGQFTFSGIKCDDPADQIGDQNRNLRRISWEIPQSALPGAASNRDYFFHAGHKWQVLEAARRDDIGKWWLTVSDEGPAA